jgi:hypothetical protein
MFFIIVIIIVSSPPQFILYFRGILYMELKKFLLYTIPCFLLTYTMFSQSIAPRPLPALELIHDSPIFTNTSAGEKVVFSSHRLFCFLLATEHLLFHTNFLLTPSRHLILWPKNWGGRGSIASPVRAGKTYMHNFHSRRLFDF